MTNYLIIEKENLKGEIDQIIIPTNLLVIEQSGQITYIHTINGLTFKLYSEIEKEGNTIVFPTRTIITTTGTFILTKEWLVQ